MPLLTVLLQQVLRMHPMYLTFSMKDRLLPRLSAMLRCGLKPGMQHVTILCAYNNDKFEK
jgi:hypothetical protein